MFFSFLILYAQLRRENSDKKNLLYHASLWYVSDTYKPVLQKFELTKGLTML